MSIIDDKEIKEHDFSRTMWLVTFQDGEEYVCFTEEDIEMQFGACDVNHYIIVRGTWRPDQ